MTVTKSFSFTPLFHLPPYFIPSTFLFAKIILLTPSVIPHFFFTKKKISYCLYIKKPYPALVNSFCSTFALFALCFYLTSLLNGVSGSVLSVYGFQHGLSV